MKKNVKILDRAIRVSLAALILMYSYIGLLNGQLESILLIIAIVFILTSAIGVCPIYALLGINKSRVQQRSE